MDNDLNILPRILIIDDQLGRQLAGGKSNSLRHAWRLTHGLLDVSGDGSATQNAPRGKTIARAVFHSGQVPSAVEKGSEVQNDLRGTLDVVRKGWLECAPRDRWACVLVDLEFLTGKVTDRSSQDEPGAPEGRDQDRQPGSYFGLSLIDAIKKEFPELPVVILSSNKRHQELISERYEQTGVKVFIDKQCSLEELQDYIVNEGLIADSTELNVGYSLKLLQALRLARKFAKTRSPVLITGKSGTGKQRIAEYLNQFSLQTRNGPFVQFNCANIEKEIGYSQLFGHVKGAFTNAVADRIGLFEAAKGGELFLDELAWFDPVGQAKLLNVIEDGKVTRMGDTKFIDVDVRVLAGTNADLDKLIAEGKLLEDLYFRLNVVNISLPTLAERMDDLEMLVNSLIRKFDRRERPRKIGNGLLEYLRSYSWPGNIRELSNLIEAACGRDQEALHLLPGDVLIPLRVKDRQTDSVVRSNSFDRSSVAAGGDQPIEKPPLPEGLRIAGSDNSLPQKLTVDELFSYLEKVELAADKPDELRGLFGSEERFVEISNTLATRLILLAMDKCSSESEREAGEYNFQKTIQLLYDSGKVKTTKFNQIVAKYCLELKGPIGDEFRERWNRKKQKHKGQQEASTGNESVEEFPSS